MGLHLNLTDLTDADLTDLSAAITAEVDRRTALQIDRAAQRVACARAALTPLWDAVDAWVDANRRHIPTAVRTMVSPEQGAILIYCPNGTVREGEQLVRSVQRLMARRPGYMEAALTGPGGSAGTILLLTRLGEVRAAHLLRAANADTTPVIK